MKYIIDTFIILLLTLTLNATEPNMDDIIVPEYFSSMSNQTEQEELIDETPPISENFQNNLEEERAIEETTLEETAVEETTIIDAISSENTINYQSASNSEIIIPESLKSSSEEEEEEPTKNTASSKEYTDSPKEPITTFYDTDTDIPDQDYSGYYKLVTGTTSMGDMSNTFENGFLVIEKLDENDFGYYYAVQTNKHYPDGRYGIFHYKNKRFFQKIIGDSELRDTVKLEKYMKESTMMVKTIYSDNKGTHAIEWEESSPQDISFLDKQLQKYLQDIKNNYQQIYKEKFTN